MTLLWDVQPYLKTLFTTATDLSWYYAGELVGEDDRVFGTVGEPGENGDTATAELNLSQVGNVWYDERGFVPCSVTAWSGETDLTESRAQAKAALAACVAAVKADKRLGGLLVPPGFAEVSTVRLREGQTDRGLAIEAGFTVSYTAAFT